MARILVLGSVRIKRNRVTLKPATPFGSGILAPVPFAGIMPFTAADADWAARAFNEDGPSDEEFDAMAREYEWERLIEAGFSFSDRCSLCGYKVSEGAELTGSMCQTCSGALDQDTDIDLGQDTCPVCGDPSVEDSGLCLRHDLAAAGASTRCQTGLRRVY